MNPTLFTEPEFADSLGMPLSTVQTLRKTHDWPYIQLGKRIYYSAELVAQIAAMHTRRTSTVELTERSKARHR